MKLSVSKTDTLSMFGRHGMRVKQRSSNGVQKIPDSTQRSRPIINGHHKSPETRAEMTRMESELAQMKLRLSVLETEVERLKISGSSAISGSSRMLVTPTLLARPPDGTITQV